LAGGRRPLADFDEDCAFRPSYTRIMAHGEPGTRWTTRFAIALAVAFFAFFLIANLVFAGWWIAEGSYAETAFALKKGSWFSWLLPILTLLSSGNQVFAAGQWRKQNWTEWRSIAGLGFVTYGGFQPLSGSISEAKEDSFWFRFWMSVAMVTVHGGYSTWLFFAGRNAPLGSGAELPSQTP